MNTYIPDAILDAPGLTQKALTVVVENTVSNMLPGSLLEVRTDDPTVKKGIERWCFISGNKLLIEKKHGHNRTAFVIKHSVMNESDTQGKSINPNY